MSFVGLTKVGSGCMVLLLSFVATAQEAQPVLARDIYLAMEVCPPAKFSFCNNGTDTGPRMEPLFIKLDRQDVLESYNKGVYSFFCKSKLDFSKLHYDLADAYRKLDSLETAVSSLNTLEFNNRYLEKGLRKYCRNVGVQIAIDGRFAYALFKMTIRYIPLEKERVLIPNLQMKHRRDKLFIEPECPVNQIVEVGKFEPVSLDEWIKSADH